MRATARETVQAIVAVRVTGRATAPVIAAIGPAAAIALVPEIAPRAAVIGPKMLARAAAIAPRPRTVPAAVPPPTVAVAAIAAAR